MDEYYYVYSKKVDQLNDCMLAEIVGTAAAAALALGTAAAAAESPKSMSDCEALLDAFRLSDSLTGLVTALRFFS